MPKSQFKKQQKGLYEDGVWKCDCEPRLPTARFQVKKEETGNKGRWFYKCQQPEAKSCKFWLWADEAAERERESRPKFAQAEQSEPIGKAPADTLDDSETDIENQHFRQLPREAGNQLAAQGNRNQPSQFGGNNHTDQYNIDDDDDELLQLNADITQQWVEEPSTPRRAIRTVQVVTPDTGPSRKRARDSSVVDHGGSRGRLYGIDVDMHPGLPTPQTGENSNKRQMRNFNRTEDAPTPSRKRTLRQELEVLEKTPPNLYSPPPRPDAALTFDVFATMREGGISLPDSLRSRLQDLLNRYAWTTEGITKGRELARAAVKAKNAKIVELEATISRFEAERESDRLVIRNLREELGLHKH